MYSRRRRAFVGWALLALAQSGCADPSGSQPAQEPTSTAVRLGTPTGTLHGTLVLPPRDGPHPVVLIVPGSGSTDRDGNSPLVQGQNDGLRMLSEGIAGRGVASLRFDKRGVGASHSALGNESDLRFGIYVDDAAAWIRWLDADPRFSRVTVLGHSERSLVGMLAARVAPADVFISVAGPARRGSDILRGQLRPQISEGLRKENERILGELEAGRTVASVPEELATLYRPSIQPYLISWFRHLPSQEIAAVTQPTFVLHGTQDLQVPVAEAEALRPARPDVELRIVSGMNHVLKLVPANPVQQNLSYSDPALPVAPELIKEMTRFTSAVRSAP